MDWLCLFFLSFLAFSFLRYTAEVFINFKNQEIITYFILLFAWVILFAIFRFTFIGIRYNLIVAFSKKSDFYLEYSGESIIFKTIRGYQSIDKKGILDLNFSTSGNGVDKIRILNIKYLRNSKNQKVSIFLKGLNKDASYIMQKYAKI